MPANGRVRPSRALVLSLLAIAAVATPFLWVIFVPVWGDLPSAPAPAMNASVPDNAWEDYARALADLETETVPGWLTELADMDGLDAAKSDYLARHAAAVASLRAGARRTGFAYFKSPAEVGSTVPHLQRLRTLSQVAVAEADRLRREGRPKEALALALDTFRYGTELMAPEQGALLPIVGAGCRRTAAAALFASLRAGDLPAEDWEKAVAALHGERARTPSAAVVLRAEFSLVERSVQSRLLSPHAAGPRPLRERAFARFLERHEAVWTRVAPAIASGDFLEQNLDDVRYAEEGKVDTLRDRVWPPDIVAWDALRSIKGPSARICRLFYVDAATATAVEALAACRAWQARHGTWPTNLAEAAAAFGVQPWRDPVTGAPAGYRLEGGLPVLFLPGFDRIDGGGRYPYDDVQLGSGGAGRDLVYRLDSIPAMLWKKQPVPESYNPPAR